MPAYFLSLNFRQRDPINNDAGMDIEINTSPESVHHKGSHTYLASLQKLAQHLNAEWWLTGRLIAYCGHADCTGGMCGITRGERIRCIVDALQEAVPVARADAWPVCIPEAEVTVRLRSSQVPSELGLEWHLQFQW